MVVIDASAMVEVLIGKKPDVELAMGLFGEISAPHALDAEVLSAIRGLERGGKLEPTTADRARRQHFEFKITRQEVQPFADRIWALRHQFTTYDASYIALAEALDAPVYTCDAKLDSDAHQAEVRVFPRTD